MAWTELQIQDDTDPGVAVAGTGPDGTPGVGQSYFGDVEFVVDGTYSQSDFTADAVAGETGVNNESSLEAKRKAQAAAAGVQDARYAGYAEVLANYANRSDVETLAERRARHLGYDPAQQSFTRAADYDAGAGTSDAPQTEYPDVTDEWQEDDHSGTP